MKVACIGNMNNNFFSTVRYLRDGGVDAELVLLSSELSQFPPSADTFELDYLKYTKSVAWGDHFGFTKFSAADIARDLEPYDFLISCGQAPAFIEKAGRHTDIFVPYGTDLVFFPFYRLTNPMRQIPFWLFTQAQRKAIRKCGWVHMDATNPEWEGWLDSIGGSAQRLKLGLPMVYTPLYSPETITRYHDRSHWYVEFKKIRDRHDILLFHHARLQWVAKVDGVMRKDNDKFLKGFADFVHGNPGGNAGLVLVEYGIDVEPTRALIRELGIEDRVYWFPRMSRKDLMIGVNLSDMVATGEFFKSYLTFGTVNEALAFSKPVIHYREDALYEDSYPDLYPMINLREPKDVTEALEDYVANPARYREMGETGRKWFERYTVEKPLAKYLEIIEAAR